MEKLAQLAFKLAQPVGLGEHGPFADPVLRDHASRIEEELHDALTGHTSASVGRKYGDGVPLEVLPEAVAKVSYKGLDLSHLYSGRGPGRQKH